jgi:transcriptional regulator with XRE-family HTH domain
MGSKREARLGPAIRSRRQALGLTQAELAAAAEVADETVSRIERSRLTPSVEMARRLAAALDTTLDELHEQKRSTREPKLRVGEARLLGLVRGLTDTEVEDVARAVRILLGVGRK